MPRDRLDAILERLDAACGEFLELALDAHEQGQDLRELFEDGAIGLRLVFDYRDGSALLAGQRPDGTLFPIQTLAKPVDDGPPELRN
jgi:hypothetical protein